MKIRAAISPDVLLYDLVSFDNSLNKWTKASSHTGVIGSIIGIDAGATEAIISPIKAINAIFPIEVKSVLV